MDASRLLVTVDELRVWQRSRVGVLDADGDYAALALGAAQEGLRAYLGYDPLVHKTARRRLRWSYPTGAVNGRVVASDGVPWEAYGSGPAPVVQADPSPYVPAGQGADYYTVTVSEDGTRLEVEAAEPLPAFADLYEGWRGSHHTLTDPAPDGSYLLTDLDGLSGLTALPPLVPDGLRLAITEAAIYYALRPRLLGVTSVEIDLGSQVKRAEMLREYADLGAIYGLHAARYRRYNV